MEDGNRSSEIDDGTNMSPDSDDKGMGDFDDSVDGKEYPNGNDEKTKVACAICGKEYIFISPFHLRTHGVTMAEYREQYPDVDLGVANQRTGASKPVPKEYTGPLVKCEVCGKEMQFVSFFHLRTHGLTIQTYKEKYPNADLGSPRKKVDTEKTQKITQPSKIAVENTQSETEQTVDIPNDISSDVEVKKEEVGDERVTCEVCGEKFFILNTMHLRKHDLTVEQYQEQYPDAKMGSTRSSSTNYHDMVTYDNPINPQSKEFLSLNIVEDGKLDILRPEKAAYVRFRELRTRVGWTVSETLHTLIDFYEKYENDEGTKIAIDQMKHAGSGLPKDFIPQHRDKLQRILTILEEKAFEEKDPVKLASLTDKIIKINLALPQLEKTDESLVDLKIKEIVEKRKLVFANSLPEFN